MAYGRKQKLCSNIEVYDTFLKRSLPYSVKRFHLADFWPLGTGHLLSCGVLKPTSASDCRLQPNSIISTAVNLFSLFCYPTSCGIHCIHRPQRRRTPAARTPWKARVEMVLPQWARIRLRKARKGKPTGRADPECSLLTLVQLRGLSRRKMRKRNVKKTRLLSNATMRASKRYRGQFTLYFWSGARDTGDPCLK